MPLLPSSCAGKAAKGLEPQSIMTPARVTSPETEQAVGASIRTVSRSGAARRAGILPISRHRAWNLVTIASPDRRCLMRSIGTYRWAAQRMLLSAKNKVQEIMSSAEFCESWPTPARPVIAKMCRSDHSVSSSRSDNGRPPSKDRRVPRPQTHPDCVPWRMQRGPLFCL